MFGLILVGIIWGSTNFLLAKATDEPKGPDWLPNWIRIVLNWKFFIPFALNQIGSLLFYYFLGSNPLSVGIPLANATSFVAATVCEKGQDIRLNQLAGIALTILGLSICITSQMDLRVTRFLSHRPAAILDLAVHDTYCIVLKADSSIWVYKAWTLLYVIPGDEDVSLRRLVFSREGEFVAVGMSSKVLLYKIGEMIPSKVTISGGGVLDIAVQGHFFAHANNDGSLHLYKYKNHYRMFSAFQRQEGSMTCVTWCGAENIASGNDQGSLFIWETASHVALNHIEVGSPVRSLAYSAGSVVSGDDSGSVKIWEPRFGTLVKSINQHRAPILALASDSSNALYASGINSQIIKITNSENQWKVDGKYRGQSQTVRAIVNFMDQTLISGGDSLDICLYPADVFSSEGTFATKGGSISFQRRKLRRISALPSQNLISTYVENEIVYTLLSQRTHLEYWSIRESSAEMMYKIFVEGPGHVVCHALTKNWIAYSTTSKLRLVSSKNNLEVVETNLSPCSVMSFTKDHLVTAGKTIQRLNLTTQEIETIPYSGPLCTALSVSDDYIAVHNTANGVCVYSGMELYFTLPEWESWVTAMNLTAKSTLTVAFETNEFLVFELKTRTLHNFSHKYGSKFPVNYLKEPNRTIGLRSLRSHQLLLNTQYSYTIIDLRSPPPKRSAIKLKRPKSTWNSILADHPQHGEVQAKKEVQKYKHNFGINKTIGPILNLTSAGSWVFAVELLWEEVLENQGPARQKKMYGN